MFDNSSAEQYLAPPRVLAHLIELEKYDFV